MLCKLTFYICSNQQAKKSVFDVDVKLLNLLHNYEVRPHLRTDSAESGGLI